MTKARTKIKAEMSEVIVGMLEIAIQAREQGKEKLEKEAEQAARRATAKMRAIK